MRDYYEILSVSRDADTDTIKKAYRKLALQYHPDRNDGDKDSEELFKEATEAYEVLRDADKRAAYDRYGHAGVKRTAGGGPDFGGFNFADALEVFMRDFGGFGFEDLFGGGAGRRGGTSRGGVRRGADVRVRLPLTLEDVATGVHRSIKLQLLNPCEECNGTGARKGAAPVRCPSCGGTGEIRRVQRSFLGQMVSVSPCPACGGEGQRIADPCPSCEGEGVKRVEKTIEVDMPPGVSSGDYITMRSAGNAGARGGVPGDILVVAEVADDPRFERDGADLVYDLAITFSQAALGADLEIPTVGDPARVKIPAGMQSGRLIRLRGKGLPHLQGGGKGDIIVRVTVWTPTDLTSDQEALFRKLSELEAAPPVAGEGKERGFWSKVREAFTA